MTQTRIWNRDERGGLKQIAAVLQVVTDGPSTSQDVADELGIPRKTACAVLIKLHSDGLLKRKRLEPAEPRPGMRSFLYELAGGVP